MRDDGYSSARHFGIESLEKRRLFSVSLSPLQSTLGARFNFIETDSAGNIYAVGDFQGTTTFDKAGKIKLKAIGDNDLFIMRIAASNGAMIVRQLGCTSAPTNVQKVVTSVKLNVQDGHLTLIGSFNGHVDLDPTKGVHAVDAPGNGDGFVVDLSAGSLSYNWSAIMGGSGVDDTQALDRDSKGNTWVTGYFQSTISFPGKTVHKLKSAGEFDGFVAKYSPTGQYLYSAKFGGGGTDLLHGVAIDSKDNVFLGGQFQKTIDTNPGTAKANLLTSGKSTSGMLIELNSAGAFKASRGFIDHTGFAALTDIAVDAKGSVYVLGNYDGVIDVDPGSAVKNLTSKGFGDVWLGKLDSTLKTVWNTTFGAAGTDQAQDLYIDSKGQLLVCGSVQQTIDLNPSKATAILTTEGSSDAFVSSYSAAGKFLGAVQIGGGGDATGFAIARSGNQFVLAVDLQGATDLAPRRLPPSGTPLTPVLFDSGQQVLCDIVQITPGLLGSV